jgi:hypothetical protein
MKSILLLSAITLAAPALAQTAAPPASTNAAQSATTVQQAPQPATDAPAAQSPTATQAEAAPANPADAVAAVVANDWAKYDGNTDGNLSKEEFASWMTALREQNPAQKAAVKDVNAWTTAAFTQADKDKSGAVSKDELQGFLKG